MYVESKVTIYPGSVEVAYVLNQVVRTGAATVIIPKKIENRLKSVEVE